jgi:CHAP domain
MSSGLDIVNIASQQVGFIEGDNNDTPYGTWYGMNHEPYCAMFVSWVFHQANLSALVAAETPNGFSYCPAGLTWFQKNGQIVDKYKAQPGDIVFFNFSGNGVAEHVGIIEGASADGITTIEGNTSPDHATGSQANGIGVFRRHRPYLGVMGIARPKYPAPVAPAKSLATSKPLAVGTAGITALGGGTAAVVANNHSSTPPPKTTVIVAPPFPGSAAFKVGSKGTAQLIVARALANAGLLPANLVSNVLTAEEIALIPVYQKKYPGLKNSVGKGIDQWTYTSMTAKAGS